jgi:hypothetical protein
MNIPATIAQEVRLHFVARKKVSTAPVAHTDPAKSSLDNLLKPIKKGSNAAKADANKAERSPIKWRPMKKRITNSNELRKIPGYRATTYVGAIL